MLSLGLIASLAFQALLTKERWSSLARYTWATADMILFSSLVLFSDGLTSPLVAGYSCWWPPLACGSANDWSGTPLPWARSPTAC